VVLYLHGHDKVPDLGSDPGWRGRLAALNGEPRTDDAPAAVATDSKEDAR
jgi:hypothetical protein